MGQEELTCTVQQLSTKLEDIHHNFAYEMIFLEINLFNYQKQTSKNDKSHKISQLTSLYMKAVQTLQGSFDLGFKYFNDKIKSMMKKRQIIEQLFKSVNSSIQNDKQILTTLERAQVIQRKEEYSLKMSMNNIHVDKIKQFIKNTEHKINLIQCRVKTQFTKQQQKLQERIRLRKQKSQKSLNGDDTRIRQVQFNKSLLQNEEDLNNRVKIKDKDGNGNLKKITILNKKKSNVFSSFNINN